LKSERFLETFQFGSTRWRFTSKPAGEPDGSVAVSVARLKGLLIPADAVRSGEADRSGRAGGVVFNRAFFIGVDADQLATDNKPLFEILRDMSLPICLSEWSLRLIKGITNPVLNGQDCKS